MMKLNVDLQINIEVFYKLIPLIWLFVSRHAQNTQNKFAYLCKISRKTWRMKLIFCLQISTTIFSKFIALFFVCIVRSVQSIQYNKFTISLQYLKENVKDEVDFYAC